MSWVLMVHVAPNQTHAGSRGAKQRTHIQRAEGAGEFSSGRLRVPVRRTLCKKARGWWERPLDPGERERIEVCPKCLDRAVRYGIECALRVASPAPAGSTEEVSGRADS
ncbi:MAG: hypothetical protein PGN13_16190 [Patulibacter minatonensis]